MQNPRFWGLAIRTRWIHFVAEMESVKTNHPLTREEEHILQMFADGNDSQSICDELEIDEDTLEVHLKNLYKKFGVKNVNEAVVVGLRKKLVTCRFIALED